MKQSPTQWWPMVTGFARVERIVLFFQARCLGVLAGQADRCQGIRQHVHRNTFVIDRDAQKLRVDHVGRRRRRDSLTVVGVRVA